MFHLFDVRTFKSNLQHCSTSFNILNWCTWQQFIELIPSTSFNKKRLLKSQRDLVRGNNSHRLQKSSNLQFTSQVEKTSKTGISLRNSSKLRFAPGIFPTLLASLGFLTGAFYVGLLDGLLKCCWDDDITSDYGLFPHFPHLIPNL
jgi:hypothetical protein